MSVFFVVIFLCSGQSTLHSQNQKLDTKFVLKNSISIQKDGMILLGSWATSNIISGTIGYYNSDNSSRYFHQMNAAWNLVNLGIAGVGYRGANAINENLGYESALKEMQNFERILLINAGLDLAYIGTGTWLWKKGLDKRSDRQIGYGKSIVLQGSFLLLFDIALYFIHNRHTNNLVQVTDQLTFMGNGILFTF